jgi:neutral ceramidase
MVKPAKLQFLDSMRRALVIALRVLAGFIGFLLITLLVSVAPVDRTLPGQQPFYEEMFVRIDDEIPLTTSSDTATFRIGFSKTAITPSHSMATAGYVKRKRAHFTSIRDSIFVRTMVIRQGETKVAIVSLDMLIVPPVLYQRLENSLAGTEFSIDELYLGATHTHNSIGHWDDHLVGEVYAGEFDPGLMDFLAQQVITSLQEADKDVRPGKIFYGSEVVPDAVTNRLIANGPVDSLLHLVEVVRQDGTKAILTSYSAHATCMSTPDLRLSRDYPGELVNRLERDGYSFAMFMAGAVGSHAPVAMESGDDKIGKMANMLFEAAFRAVRKPIKKSEIRFVRIPLLLGKQQIKVLPGWRVREWLSLRLMGEYTPSLTALKLGNVVMLGTPCDFSGMLTGPLYAKAGEKDVHAFVTSFNGGYIGYITPDELYDLKRYETQTMNWYGPGNGSYLQECLSRLIEKLNQTNP